MTRSYYRGSIGVIIVYDITKSDSLDKVRTWIQEVKQFARPEAVYIIVGNKKDLSG